MKKLNAAFYQREDVLLIARELMGKLLVTNRNGICTTGRIVECEAYAGIGDKASHAYAGRRTRRNEPMYAAGGMAYVYLCYGIHHLFNVVTHHAGTPHAILIRSVEPVEGIADMLLRTKKAKADHTLTRGPGNVASALGISTADSSVLLTTSDEIYLADDGFVPDTATIHLSPRIGVDYADEDAKLPYRFYIKGNKYVSGKPK